MPQISKSDYAWLRSHRESIIKTDRYVRYAAAITLWLGVSILNYLLLASFPSQTLQLEILIFGFELALVMGSYQILCNLTNLKSIIDMHIITFTCIFIIVELFYFLIPQAFSIPLPMSQAIIFIIVEPLMLLTSKEEYK